jgi:hypothetical protein
VIYSGFVHEVMEIGLNQSLGRGSASKLMRNSHPNPLTQIEKNAGDRVCSRRNRVLDWSICPPEIQNP